MRSIVVEHAGEHGAVQELPDPVPAAHELLVRVTIAAVNPVDWKLRDLYGKPMPFTLGQDFAGTVVGLGSDVSGYAYGDRVAGIARKHGAYSNLTIIPVGDHEQPLAHIPAGVGDADAAALPTPGLTAVECVQKAECGEGRRVLIVGVMGAVGQITAQLAMREGATIIGVGHSRTESAARQLGVTEYIAYDTAPDHDAPAAARGRMPEGVDVVIDMVGDARTVLSWTKALRPGGLLLSTNHAFDEMPTLPDNIVAKNANLDDGATHTTARLRDLLKLIEAGELKVPIGQEFDFRSAVQALDDVKAGIVKGKALITIGD